MVVAEREVCAELAAGVDDAAHEGLLELSLGHLASEVEEDLDIGVVAELAGKA